MSAETLYRLFMDLAEIGRPYISRQKSGAWHASVEFPAPDGVTAEVRSDFDHATPVEALQTVHDRLGGLRNMLNVPSPVVGINHSQVSS